MTEGQDNKVILVLFCRGTTETTRNHASTDRVSKKKRRRIEESPEKRETKLAALRQRRRVAEPPELCETRLAADRDIKKEGFSRNHQSNAKPGLRLFVNEGVSRNHQSNAKPGLRLIEIVKKEGVSMYYKSNVCIIAWHSSTALPMIIA